MSVPDGVAATLPVASAAHVRPGPDENSGRAALPWPATAGALGLVLIATLALAARFSLIPGSLPAEVQSGLFVLVFVAIWISSCLVPVPVGAATRGAAPLNPWVVLAVGAVAVGAATLAGGPPLPLPLSPWALPMMVLAAVAEEALFRRAAYGALERFGVPVAIIGSAVLFALMHVPVYGIAVLPVDLGAGLLLSWQRWASGTWTVPAATHAGANALMVVLR